MSHEAIMKGQSTLNTKMKASNVTPSSLTVKFNMEMSL